MGLFFCRQDARFNATNELNSEKIQENCLSTLGEMQLKLRQRIVKLMFDKMELKKRVRQPYANDDAEDQSTVPLEKETVRVTLAEVLFSTNGAQSKKRAYETGQMDVTETIERLTAENQQHKMEKSKVEKECQTLKQRVQDPEQVIRDKAVEVGLTQAREQLVQMKQKVEQLALQLVAQKNHDEDQILKLQIELQNSKRERVLRTRRV